MAGPIIRRGAGWLREAFPGILKDPRQLADEAAAVTAPESEALGRLFGVTRADLASIADQPGNVAGQIPGLSAKPRGAAVAPTITQPENTQRLVQALQAGQERAPALMEGMKGWYITDPAYLRLVELVGPEEATRRFERFNTLTAMASPGSDVESELMRGTAANKLFNERRFNEFQTYGGITADERAALGLADDLTTFPGHPYHSTAQAGPMATYLNTGQVQLQSPKVPMYMQASRPTQMGRQSDTLVGDAHWSRAVGLADARPMRKVKGEYRVPGQSVSKTELQSLAPWWREEVAQEVGLEAVPAQASAWGLFAPQTGVETVVGAPKLEILADLIMRTSRRLNISPERARDMVLMGEAQAGRIDPTLLAAMGGGGTALAAGVAGGNRILEEARRRREGRLAE